VNNGRAEATVMADARRACERRLNEGQPLTAVESYIRALPISSQARASLWLWAWAWGERPDSRRRGRVESTRRPVAGSA
jgi:hypothetical protein